MSQQESDPHARHRHHHHGGRHGNPEDLKDYVARLESPEREDWQEPDEVIRALGVREGQTIADVGGGPGWFSRRWAKAVGPSGHVFAVDVEPALLAVLRDRLAEVDVQNVTPVLARPDAPLLPPKSCDLAVIVNTYHHFPDGPAYLRRLALALKEGGRLVNIDFHRRELPVGPPVEHKAAREDFLAAAEAAGLELVTEHGFLPYQYFLVFQPR